jgi:hypothetical protein
MLFMRIIVATISIFFLSFFANLLGVDTKQTTCSHCIWIQKNDPKIKRHEGQPEPYIHDKDSTLMIFPILENADIPGESYIQDVKFIYKDLHYCSDMSKITIVNKNGNFSSISLQKMSCKIIATVRFKPSHIEQLSTVPTQKIIIENIVTDNVYEYQMKDSLYFIKSYKNVDYKGEIVNKPVDKKPPVKRGQIK